MDKEALFGGDFDSVAKEITTVKEHFKETITLGKDLKQSLILLKEEIQIARDQEKTAQFQRKTSLAFVSQQQEVIANLTSAKEENENLKLMVNHLESEVKKLQQTGADEQRKFINELEKVRHEHFSEMTQIKENADEELLEVKHQLEVNVSDLMSQLEFVKKERHDELVRLRLEHNEEVKKLNNTIASLQSENKELKERSAANISIYQKKLADQERYYLGEIEVWKQAELSQMTLRYEQPLRFQGGQSVQATSSAVLKPPLNIVSNLKKPPTASYQTANQLYQQQQDQQQQIRQQQQRLQQQQLQQQLEQEEQQLQLQQQQLERDESSVQQMDSTDTDVHDQMPTVTKMKMKFPIAVKKRKLFSHDSNF